MLTWKDIVHFSIKGNPAPDRRVEKTEAEWRELLTPEQFRITRKKGTEAPHSGALCSSYEAGKYNCICCGTPLFDSTIKFESGTGWPSFTQPIRDNAIAYKRDSSFGMIRVEVLCNTCDAHLGHVFPDGPEPSGLRYCINSESLKLQKEETYEQ
ncbi:MAG: peptide-methionine (R)-S-oxide reductase MsrB [Bacteroidota bacterium]